MFNKCKLSIIKAAYLYRFYYFLARIQLETSFYPISNFKLKTKQKTVCYFNYFYIQDEKNFHSTTQALDLETFPVSNNF
jgi:hypothetical protein